MVRIVPAHSPASTARHRTIGNLTALASCPSDRRQAVPASLDIYQGIPFPSITRTLGQLERLRACLARITRLTAIPALPYWPAYPPLEGSPTPTLGGRACAATRLASATVSCILPARGFVLRQYGKNSPRESSIERLRRPPNSASSSSAEHSNANGTRPLSRKVAEQA